MSFFKRMLCGCLAFTLTVSTVGVLSAYAEKAPPVIVGDTDGNSVIDVSDATLLQMYLANGGTDPVRDDCDRNGVVDISDATYIQMFAAELLGESSPIGKPAEESEHETSAPLPGFRLNVDSLTLGKGESFLLAADSALSEPPVFTSDAPDIVSVDESGLITAMETGTAVITCEINGETQGCAVTVCPMAKTLGLNKESLILGLGEIYDLNSYVEDGAAAYERVYSTDNDSVATVTESGGFVTAKALGKAIITCTLTNGVKAICEVTVKPLAESLELNKNKLTVEVGESFDFNSTVPSGTAAYFRNYYSEDSSVAKINISGGLMTAVAEGTTRVYCELCNGVRAYAEVIVTKRSVVRAAMVSYLCEQLGKNSSSYIDYINSHSKLKVEPDSAWCTIFSWCCLDVFAENNGYEKLFEPVIFVSDIADQAKELGALKNAADSGYVPKPGDLFLIAQNKHPVSGQRLHIGFVEYVETDKNGKPILIHTIEGNYNWENEFTLNTKVSRGVWKLNEYDAYGDILSEFIDLTALYPDKPDEPTL